MTARTKIPLQVVVRALCEVLTDLPPDDQERALEAVRVTLGLDAPVVTVWDSEAASLASRSRASEPDPVPRVLWETSLFQEPAARRALPTVVVQMMGDRPRVVGQQVGRPCTIVLVGMQHDQRRRLSAPRASAAAPPAQSPGSRRGGYVRSIR